ncbi:tRNA-modifying protein YgfZ [Buchnera aphidicola]|uniref:tRNA-modifying protein YgfZ n=1 Tax=Buchnera aphidicola subsp. Rhopalosiphum maidis TaxID=118109 RepID=A0A3G2I5E5_BUCRM|nr:tRNA-modifying protein YgfZ [Buchnera aphidicola]AYN24644.1 tRNA-modifying protein YgfZ [Buchnera aphidicola (Rhopalosiphum maidis)]
MLLFNFLKKSVYPSTNLPLTLSLLEEWCLVYIDGLDGKKHLQNQFTIDINFLKKEEYKLCAHCNFNGKVWATMFLFHYKKGYAYIIRKSIVKTHIKELKKYAVFSKVQIRELDNIFLFGLSGIDAKLFLSKYFIDIPNEQCPLTFHEDKTILWFSKPFERFLLVLSLKDLFFLRKKENEIILLNNSKQWLLLDIEAGFPIIDEQNSQKFLPQSINLTNLQAVSFNKGCYYGQETIARVFHKNLNKHELYILSSTGNINPKIGSIIEMKKDEKWYRIGFLLAIVHVKVNEIVIQAVLNKSVKIQNIFRIYEFKNIFLIKN